MILPEDCFCGVRSGAIVLVSCGDPRRAVSTRSFFPPMNVFDFTVRRCLVVFAMAAAAGLYGPLSAEEALKKLTVLTPATLGESAGGTAGVCAAADLGQGRWAVVWLNPAGQIVGSTGKAGKNKWSKPTPVLGGASAAGFATLTLTGDSRTGWRLSARKPGDATAAASVWRRRAWTDAWAPQTTPADQAPPAGLPDGVLASAENDGTKLVLRSGRRVVGVKPHFPGAGLVVSRAEAGGLQDLAFADEVPDAKIDGAALATAGGNVLAAYVVQDGSGRNVCRVVQLPANTGTASSSAWHQRPSYPQEPGMAGPQSGVHNGVLIIAGGTNWPEPRNKKKWYDDIYALVPGEKTWRPAGKLPAPRAYGAAVSLPGGVLVMGGDGGDSAELLCQDAFLMAWDGAQVRISPMPALPNPVSNSMAVVLDGVVYYAGGNSGSPRMSRGEFWRLDLARPAAGWQPLPTWPGPTRSHAVMAALDGAIYLLSGLETRLGADGKAQSTYLTDAYRYRPEKQSWERLPDLPWSAIAAPSPAPVTTSPGRVFVLGGVDGQHTAGGQPGDKRLPDDVIYFDVAAHQWKLWPERWPTSVVTIPAVASGSEWHFVSGELKGGRTTEVWTWRIDAPAGNRRAP